MEECNYIVYKHTCPNNKVYIGITRQNINKRWNNGNGYKNNKHFYSAIKKYGWNNIKHEIIKENITQDEATKIEIKLIDEYKSNQKEYGYNNSIGGEKSSLGFHHSKQSKEKISKNNARYWKDKKLSDETKRKLSESKKGKHIGMNNAFYGKHHTEEAKEKNRIAHIGKIAWNKNTKGIMKANKTSFKKGQASVNRKKVICIETNVVYDSILEASRQLNISQMGIINVCKDRQENVKNLHWKYLLD